VMIAELFFGISFNLSLWYKLTDRTAWGMWLSLFGLAATIGLNVLLVPKYGYMGCAWAAFGCYGSMMALSYILGRIYYPINYNLPKLAFYFFAAIALWIVSEVIAIDAKPWLNMIVRTPLLAAYILMVVRMEHIRLSNLIPRHKKH
ncbi:MAG: polysaccharide biosynthesis C-terminal domain-containing protein, partial [Duncaniella sp.]|nr:polysaccharide biosynthesis C-terminal domain-containing protein [Duncaniella sp.]